MSSSQKRWGDWKGGPFQNRGMNPATCHWDLVVPPSLTQTKNRHLKGSVYMGWQVGWYASYLKTQERFAPYPTHHPFLYHLHLIHLIVQDYPTTQSSVNTKHYIYIYVSCLYITLNRAPDKLHTFHALVEAVAKC